MFIQMIVKSSPFLQMILWFSFVFIQLQVDDRRLRYGAPGKCGQEGSRQQAVKCEAAGVILT